MPSRTVRLTFPSFLCPTFPACHYLFPSADPVHLMAHPWVISAFTSVCRSSAVPKYPSHRLQRRSASRVGSIPVMLRPAGWLERLTGPRRRLTPPTGPPVYGRACPRSGLPARSLLSLLGPTIHCRGRTFTCKYVKDRRLHHTAHSRGFAISHPATSEPRQALSARFRKASGVRRIPPLSEISDCSVSSRAIPKSAVYCPFKYLAKKSLIILSAVASRKP